MTQKGREGFLLSARKAVSSLVLPLSQLHYLVTCNMRQRTLKHSASGYLLCEAVSPAFRQVDL